MQLITTTTGAGLVLLLNALLAACSEPRANARLQPSDTLLAPNSAANTTAGPKACDLLNADTISLVTHHVLKPGVTTNDYMGDSQCKYANADGSAGGVMVALHAQGDLANYRKVPGSKEISDLGDGAVWNSSTTQLAVSSGTNVFSISFLTPPSSQQWAIQLARAALASLSQQ